MKACPYNYCYQQIHIDAARNATDDFNPFHDQNKWNRIRDNPSGVPIAPGFQVEALIEYLVTLFRERSGELAMFPVSLLSCALLEKAKQDNYAFESNPVIYTSHNISVDRRLLQSLKSNDCLNLLVSIPETVPAGKGPGKKGFPQQLHRCFGLLAGNQILFRAEVVMAPLKVMLQGSRT